MFPPVYSAKVHGVRKVNGVHGPGTFWCSRHGAESGKPPGTPNRRLAMDLGLPPSSDTTPGGPLLCLVANQHFLAERWCGGEGSAVRGCPLAQLSHPWARDAVHALPSILSSPSRSQTIAVGRASREKAARSPPAAHAPPADGSPGPRRVTP